MVQYHPCKQKTAHTSGRVDFVHSFSSPTDRKHNQEKMPTLFINFKNVPILINIYMFVLTKLKKSSLHEKKQEKTTIFQKSDFLNFAPKQETNLQLFHVM